MQKTKRFFAKDRFITLEIFDYHQKFFQCCLGIKHSSFSKRNSFFFPLLRVGVMCCRPRRSDMGSPGKGVADGRAGGGQREGGMRCDFRAPVLR